MKGEEKIIDGMTGKDVLGKEETEEEGKTINRN